jgi:cardiolipin synthase
MEAAVQPREYRDPEPFSVEAQGVSLTFHPGGPDRFGALLALLQTARESLDLTFYIYADDESGLAVREALTSAARRGVKVRLIVDGFGAEAGERFFAPLIEAGGEFRCFMARWSRRYLIRNHQKIVIADGRVAMLGGFNIENSYFLPAGEDRWQDLAFTFEGQVVGQVSAWFEELYDWTAHPKQQFRSIRRKVRGWKPGAGPVRLLIGGPTKGLSSWALAMSHDLIEGERLDMVMAYFSPPPRLLKRLRRIARKGQTRLVFPARSDNGATIGAARLLYGGLLKARARIWEFEPCKLHTKLVVLDDAVYLGSANLDMRSLYLNLEIVLCIEDAALAARMREYIDELVPAATAITPALHAERAGWLSRLRWSASWFLVSVVDYTVSRRLNLGL